MIDLGFRCRRYVIFEMEVRLFLERRDFYSYLEDERIELVDFIRGRRRMKRVCS